MERLLFAPSGYWELDAGQRADLCNGCGTKGLCGVIVPDTFYGLCVTPACDIHDYMYVTGETIDDKIRADSTFLNNCLRLIEAGTRWNWLKRLRARRARIYYEAVKRLGGPAFWAGK
jgi:hypothetical protein